MSQIENVIPHKPIRHGAGALALGCDGNKVYLQEGRYVARLINPTNLHEVRAYQRLRYDWFVLEKGWILPDPDRPDIETDRYDDYAWHLGVFSADSKCAAESGPDSLLSYLRVLAATAPCDFMLDHEFACLITDEERARLPRLGAVELSRLVPRSQAGTNQRQRNGTSRRRAMEVELLLKLLYHLSLDQGIEHYYIVVEKAWLKPFARCFHMPFQPIGRPVTFPDGTETVAAYTTRVALEKSVSSHDPDRYAWYRQRCEGEP